MKLVHYSRRKLGPIVALPQPEWFMKPNGLWLSDDDCEANWPERKPSGRPLGRFVYDIALMPGASVVMLRSEADIEAFTDEWKHVVVGLFEEPVLPWPEIYDLPEVRALGFRKPNMERLLSHIRWRAVAERYAGIVITPYQYRLRHDLLWYMPWDCASGCIWDPAAIASVTLREKPG